MPETKSLCINLIALLIGLPVVVNAVTEVGPRISRSIVCAVSLRQYLFTSNAVEVKQLVTKDLTVKSFTELI